MRKIQVGDLIRLKKSTCGIPKGSLCLIEEVGVGGSPGLYRVKSLNGICMYRNAFNGGPGAFIGSYNTEVVTSTNQKSFNPPLKPTLPTTTIVNGGIDHEKTPTVSQGDS